MVDKGEIYIMSKRECARVGISNNESKCSWLCGVDQNGIYDCRRAKHLKTVLEEMYSSIYDTQPERGSSSEINSGISDYSIIIFAEKVLEGVIDPDKGCKDPLQPFNVAEIFFNLHYPENGGLPNRIVKLRGMMNEMNQLKQSRSIFHRLKLLHPK